MRFVLLLLILLILSFESFCQLSKFPPEYRDDKLLIENFDFVWDEKPDEFLEAVTKVKSKYQNTEIGAILTIRSYLINKIELSDKEIEDVITNLNSIKDCLVKIRNLNLVSIYYQDHDAVHKAYIFQNKLNKIHKSCVSEDSLNADLLLLYSIALNNEAAYLLEYITGVGLGDEELILTKKVASILESADSAYLLAKNMTDLNINSRIDILASKLGVYGQALKDTVTANRIVNEISVQYESLDDYSKRRILLSILSYKKFLGYKSNDFIWIKYANDLLLNTSYNSIYLPNAPIIYKYNIGNYHLTQNNYDTAKAYFLQAIRDTVNERSNKTLLFVQLDLSMTYSKLKDYDSAKYYLDQSRQTLDYIKSNRNPDLARSSLYNNEINELEVKYLDISNEIKEAERLKITSKYIILLAAVLLIILTLYFTGLLNKIILKIWKIN